MPSHRTTTWADFPNNLRYLCTERPSVASVCREIGINQQQFSKYLTGRARPSPHNLRRIARNFELDAAVLMQPHADLVKIRSQMPTTPGPTQARRHDPLATAFPGDLVKLRPYLGAYQIFFHAPVAPNTIVVNTVFLDERDGIVYSRIIQALKGDPTGPRRWIRCDGKAAYQDGHVFVIDSERRNAQALAMYALAPYQDAPTKYLIGTMCFLPSLPHRAPFASKVVWKRFAGYRAVRDLFETCGVYPSDSLRIDPFIRKTLSSGAMGG